MSSMIETKDEDGAVSNDAIAVNKNNDDEQQVQDKKPKDIKGFEKASFDASQHAIDFKTQNKNEELFRTQLHSKFNSITRRCVSENNFKCVLDIARALLLSSVSMCTTFSKLT